MTRISDIQRRKLHRGLRFGILCDDEVQRPLVFPNYRSNLNALHIGTPRKHVANQEEVLEMLRQGTTRKELNDLLGLVRTRKILSVLKDKGKIAYLRKPARIKLI